MTKFVAPTFGLSSFTCPHCGVLAQQWWRNCFSDLADGETYIVDFLQFTTCMNDDCNGICIWLDKELIYPLGSLAPLPYDEMPDDVKSDFLEASYSWTLSKICCCFVKTCIAKTDETFG